MAPLLESVDFTVTIVLFYAPEAPPAISRSLYCLDQKYNEPYDGIRQLIFAVAMFVSL